MLMRRVLFLLTAFAFLFTASVAMAQTPAGAAPPNPADTPSIKIGTTIFADYTLLQTPKAIDTDGNEIHANAFNVARAYLNLSGNLHHRLGFRTTADIVRETGSGGSLDGSLTFRLKFAYAEFRLDDWTGKWKDTRIRFGLQPQMFTEFEGAVYRYRFQGQTVAEREGFLTSADTGVSIHTSIPGGYGTLFAAVVNGEGYKSDETSNRKSLQLRAAVKPFAKTKNASRGFQAISFLDLNHYLNDAPRLRAVQTVAFEHSRFNIGADHVYARDQISVRAALVESNAQSIWVTPFFNRKGEGFEGLVRYDRLVPNERLAARKHRVIGGVAYWFPHQGNVTSSLLFDVEQIKFDKFTPTRPTERRWAIHMLINY